MLDFCDVLPVDADHPLLCIPQTQQQVHKRRFPSARWPDQPNTLPALDMQVDAVQTASSLTVVMGNTLKPDVTVSQSKRWRAGYIRDGVRHGEAFQTFRNITQMLKHPHGHPDDDPGHPVQPDRHRNRRCNLADRQHAIGPQQQGGPNDQHQSGRIEQRHRTRLHRKEPHQSPEPQLQPLHR